MGLQSVTELALRLHSDPHCNTQYRTTHQETEKVTQFLNVLLQTFCQNIICNHTHNLWSQADVESRILLTLNHVDFLLNIEWHTSVVFPKHNQPPCTVTHLSPFWESYQPRPRFTFNLSVFVHNIFTPAQLMVLLAIPHQTVMSEHVQARTDGMGRTERQRSWCRFVKGYTCISFVKCGYTICWISVSNLIWIMPLKYPWHYANSDITQIHRIKHSIEQVPPSSQLQVLNLEQ